MLPPKQVVSFDQLIRDGLTAKAITGMYAELKLFPTPFKGIYYVPAGEERRGEFIESPMKVLSQAIALFLGSRNFYFSCKTAEESLGINWRPSGSVHIVNANLSRRIDLAKRSKRNEGKGSWRAKKVGRLLSFYGNEIVFHKSSSMLLASVRRTPYGVFASRPQIKIDKKRFGEQ